MTTPGTSTAEVARAPEQDRASRWLGRLHWLEVALAWGIIIGMIAYVTGPIWANLERWGGHDWDATTAFRYLLKKSVLVYGEFPWWNPYAGGGYTAWGFVDSDTTIVSPWLPGYLFGDLRTMLRVEVVGMALISAIGTWLLAGRFTKSVAGRAIACVLFVVNGRWALQATSGHAWHLYYAYLPFVLFFFDRATSPDSPARRPWLEAVWAGGFIALMTYAGGIYPMPHACLAVALYALLLSAGIRSFQPFVMGAITGVVSFTAAAPKLLPMMAGFSSAPRLIESKETMDLGVLLTLLTDKSQDFGARPVRVSRWGWHEWGMYIGWLPLFLVVLAAVFVRGRRENSLKWVGLAFVLLGFGAFHEHAPWTHLHEVPVFASLHVPSRFLYPAALFLGVVLAAGVGRVLWRAGRWRPAAELGALAVVGFIAFDMGQVAREPMHKAFWMELPPNLEAQTFDYYQVQEAPPSLRYVRADWSIPLLPAMIANVGVIKSTAVGPVGVFSADASGLIPGQGAVGKGNPGYKGEYYFEPGAGEVTVSRWTPNQMVLEVSGAKPGDRLVVNQNFDRGWRVDGEPVENYQDKISVVMTAPAATLHFRYRPQLFPLGMLLLVLTAAAVGGALFYERQRRRRGFDPSARPS